MLEKLKKKSIKYKLNSETIENLKETLGLEGEGTRASPFIIENLRDFAEISLRTKSIYLVLRKLTINKLSIIDSENVIIKDCIIKDLEITACRNLKFIRNHIGSVKQLLCRDCYFDNNSILTDEYSKLINNTYERRTFVFVWICLSIGMLFTFFSVVSLTYLYLSLDSVIFLIIGVSLSIAMGYMLSLHFRLRQVPQNKYIKYGAPVKEESITSFFEIE